jgi:lysophospholipase L1-like esterase
VFAAATAAGCIVIAALLETSGRLLVRYDTSYTPPRPPSFIALYLPDTTALGLQRYCLRPHFFGQEWGTSFSLNARGFRGREVMTEKPPGVCRVLCLGDSCTFGTGGLNTDETYPAVLEELLNASGSGTERYEVINAGMPGFSVFNGYVMYRAQNLSALHPDIVVISFGWNDHLRAGFSDKCVAYQRYALMFLNEHSAFWQWLMWKLKRRNIPLWPAPKWFVRVPPGEYYRYLVAFVQAVQHDGARVVLVTAPWEPRLMHDRIGWLKEGTLESFYLHSRYVALSRRAAQRTGVTLVDMYQIIESRKTDNVCAWFNDPIHYNRTGARLAAETIAKGIRKVINTP